MTWFWDSKVVSRSITLHNDPSFQTKIAPHSHLLGDDIDKRNMAWVRLRTLGVHSRLLVAEDFFVLVQISTPGLY